MAPVLLESAGGQTKNFLLKGGHLHQMRHKIVATSYQRKYENAGISLTPAHISPEVKYQL